MFLPPAGIHNFGGFWSIWRGFECSKEIHPAVIRALIVGNFRYVNYVFAAFCFPLDMELLMLSGSTPGTYCRAPLQVQAAMPALRTETQ